MNLGEKLRNARLEAGLSQRQLCGEKISRNMLSLIENGSAKPSMDTLQYLAAKLSKPVGYFLDEQAVTSPNQAVMDTARKAYARQVYSQALEILDSYSSPDSVFDGERWLLETLCCMHLAQGAIRDKKRDYAVSLLEQAAKAGQHTPYYTRSLERTRLLLLYEARPELAPSLAAALPRELSYTLLRAEAEQDPGQQGAILDADPSNNPRWHYLRANAWHKQGEYEKAIESYKKAEAINPRQIYSRLEECCRELEDYKQAYYYACKLRE